MLMHEKPCLIPIMGASLKGKKEKEVIIFLKEKL